jgi:hypothetical protein
VIVSDASPLIQFSKVNKLPLLKKLFKTIIVPEAVFKEITAKEHEKTIFEKTGWIKTKNIENTDLTRLLEQLVDRGEAEAIILAKELDAPLIVDDAKARKYAGLLDVEVIGSLGVLKLAKNRGLITSVKEVIADMLSEGYYIEKKLIAKILQDVGE